MQACENYSEKKREKSWENLRHAVNIKLFVICDYLWDILFVSAPKTSIPLQSSAYFSNLLQSGITVTLFVFSRIIPSSRYVRSFISNYIHALCSAVASRLRTRSLSR